jgi:hypothetical protein
MPWSGRPHPTFPRTRWKGIYNTKINSKSRKWFDAQV